MKKNFDRRTDITHRRIRTIDRSIDRLRKINKNKTKQETKNLELVGKAMCYIFAKKGPLDGHRYHCDKTTEIPKCFQQYKKNQQRTSEERETIDSLPNISSVV